MTTLAFDRRRPMPSSRLCAFPEPPRPPPHRGRLMRARKGFAQAVDLAPRSSTTCEDCCADVGRRTRCHRCDRLVCSDCLVFIHVTWRKDVGPGSARCHAPTPPTPALTSG